MPALRTPAVAGVLAVTLGGCGGTITVTQPQAPAPPATTAKTVTTPATGTTTTPLTPAQRAHVAAVIKYGRRVQAVVVQLDKAAAAGDRPGVDRQERRLDALVPLDPEPPATTPGRTPYGQLIDTFPVKHGPLYARQVSYADTDHTLFVSVSPDEWCLKTATARLDAVRQVYGPADRRLRAAGVKDFVFFLVPLMQRDAKRSDALAVGRGGRLTLTPSGRRC